MNRMWLAGLLPLLLAAAPAQAEDAKPADTVPAPTNIRGQEYPRIHADLRVTFRIKAPDAKKVEFRFFAPARRIRPRQGEDGFWTATTDPQAPGFHYYRVFIDGVQVNDPSSQTFYGTGKDTSGIEIPEKGVDFYLPKDVPHGEVRERWYRSRTTDQWRRIFVYTPPGYDTNRDMRYPVLYLQHGGGEDETGLGQPGCVSFIMDNLMPSGRPSRCSSSWSGVRAQARRSGRAPSKKPAAGDQGPTGPFDFSKSFSAFEEVMVKDLIPMIDATYRTIPERDSRAMAGLSMGGIQTFQITLKHLDLFAYMGGFSGGGGGFGGAIDLKTAHNGVMADADEFNKKVRLLWLGIGTAEGRMYDGIKSYHEALDKAGDQARLLRIARHPPRVANVAAALARVRAAAVQGSAPFSPLQVRVHLPCVDRRKRCLTPSEPARPARGGAKARGSGDLSCSTPTTCPHFPILLPESTRRRTFHTESWK